jgi:twitching motility protein PilI
MEKSDKNDASTAVLGVAVGNNRYLIPMIEVNEVISIPKLARVPLTQPWFLGLANVRGILYGINDLAGYLGSDALPFNLKSRILLTSPSNKIYGGFIVNNMLGIRDLCEFTRVKESKKKLPTGIVAEYKDHEEREWRELSLFKLISEERFLQIAVNES